MKRFLNVAAVVLTVGVGLLAPRANADTTTLLADQPVFVASSVPGNMLFVLSVEYPTANAAAYPSSTSYATTRSGYTTDSTYIGYFDPAKCYTYDPTYQPPGTTSGTVNPGLFSPYGAASNHACTSTSSLHLWSGNFLNWASMQALDEFRSALTGGYRVVDTQTETVLEKTWVSNQGGTTDDPNGYLSNQATTIAGATPFTNWSTIQTSTFAQGNQMLITSSGSFSATPTQYAGQVPSASASGSGKNACKTNCANTTYVVTVRVLVCDPAVSLESNCVAYGDNYKPEGLIQQNALKIRYGIVSYLDDSSDTREGGVLRAQMAYVGPKMPSLSDPTVLVNNPNTEWDPDTGIFNLDPDVSDASNSGVSNSGVINYINKFGEFSHIYKSGDTLSELFYVGLRYYKNLGNVSLWSNGATPTMLDGFPAILSWNDPIIYSCQKNFFLGIGDVNTHNDSVVPGSTIGPFGGQTTPNFAPDTTDYQAETNLVGQMEGYGGNLGTLSPPWVPGGTGCCGGATDLIAGMAYDAHVNDMQPNAFKNADGTKSYIQTASTYWLDVQEYSQYKDKNQYYLATKYGGFKVPTGWNPTSTTAPPTSTWHTTTNMQGSDLQPDNYFDANQANLMASGLAQAFASIGSSMAASSTSFSFTSNQFPSATGNASYSSSYNPANWTGDVVGDAISFDASGNPTETQSWSAASLLNARNPATRIIATCCTSSGAGLPFEWASLTSTGLDSRTDYATFSNVGGVSASAQSGSKYLAYLRGDKSQEQTNGGAYRDRASILGDITDSKLNPVGAPNYPYADIYNPGYSAFKAAYATRPTVVYVGANDGMMHAFDGTVPGGGKELFAYVPSFVYGNDTTGPVSGLASLGNPSFVHHNLVDSTPETFDVDFNNTVGQSHDAPDWRTILIGGLGKGGNGYYAIDVTDPASITSESVLASKVLWEFTDPDMGYSFGDPDVVKTKQYGWVVILTSGYDNSSGTGFIYIVNPKTGALIQKIAVGNGSDGLPSNGLTYGSAYVQSSADDTADSYYVGDLNGHLWRLDLTPTSGAYAAPTQIADLTDSNGSPQPITTRPLIEVQPGTQKRYVLVGTGKLLDSSDIADTQQQSFYGIIDGTASHFDTAATLPAGETYPITRSDLVNDTATLTTGIGTNPSSPSGWYVNLYASGSAPAERVNVDPTANYGIVAFVANTPVGDVCNPSGANEVFGIDFGAGKSVVVNTSNEVIASSSALPGIATDISITNVGGKLYLLAGGSKGDVINIPAQLSGAVPFKQLNWSEVQSAD